MSIYRAIHSKNRYRYG